MNTATLKSPFMATLEASLAGLRQLRDILLREQQALLQNHPQDLERIVRQKAESLQQLEHSIKAREQILQQAGLPGGLTGTGQFAKQLFSQDEVSDQLTSLAELSQEVNDLNIHNGKLALAGERTTREALHILTGRPQTAATYSRKGAASDELCAHSLGSC